MIRIDHWLWGVFLFGLVWAGVAPASPAQSAPSAAPDQTSATPPVDLFYHYWDGEDDECKEFAIQAKQVKQIQGTWTFQLQGADGKNAPDTKRVLKNEKRTSFSVAFCDKDTEVSPPYRLGVHFEGMINGKKTEFQDTYQVHPPEIQVQPVCTDSGLRVKARMDHAKTAEGNWLITLSRKKGGDLYRVLDYSAESREGVKLNHLFSHLEVAAHNERITPGEYTVYVTFNGEIDHSPDTAHPDPKQEKVVLKKGDGCITPQEVSQPAPPLKGDQSNWIMAGVILVGLLIGLFFRRRV
ncbi:hypothetical protein GCM10011571_00680 [Marinithermofilum abyssi]|uniref:Uncharacterized protein n=1 Tax=Marinithermofilum abyssi TaxID=1571185 RepID=A0A8J2VGT5_9BACL|nr:hypothetical protein [Marinithermofilum abyssi]GGE03679.1 hypothetical protein GCM10011571_00680 [Marinithermofilum abyssi]